MNLKDEENAKSQVEGRGEGEESEAEESFEVYKKYQQKVHEKDGDENKSGYERFLCQVPLFDPEDQKVPENCSEEEKRWKTKKNDEKNIVV